MVFYVEFGFWGLLVIIAIMLAVPALAAAIVIQHRRNDDLQRRLSSREGTLAPPRVPERSEEAYLNFIRLISHQSTNSIQAILGAATNLNESCRAAAQPHPPEVSDYIGQIEEESHRLSQMTSRLRLLAQLEAENSTISVQSTQLRAVIADVIMRHSEAAQANGMELSYEGPDRPPRVLVNRDQISVAIENLVDNSLKYARPESRMVLLSIVPNAHELDLIVSDDGMGIPKEVQPNLFDTAYRAPDARLRRAAGSGLGLAIVKRVVEQHRGSVRMESDYGEGTTVVLTLPLDPAHVLAEQS